ncbi:MAG: hypothetical protein ACLSG8_03275 [Barnesiella sp.]
MAQAPTSVFINEFMTEFFAHGFGHSNACPMISGPIPSPGKIAMFNFI